MKHDHLPLVVFLFYGSQSASYLTKTGGQAQTYSTAHPSFTCDIESGKIHLKKTHKVDFPTTRGSCASTANIRKKGFISWCGRKKIHGCCSQLASIFHCPFIMCTIWEWIEHGNIIINERG